MLSIRARLLRHFARRYFRRVQPGSDIALLRASFEERAGHLGTARGVETRNAAIAGIECDWLVPKGCDDAPVLYYLHGGAYVMGSSRTHRHMVSHIARAAGVRALLPNYRLAPEHRYPAGLEDACAVYRELLRQGVAAERVVAGGDSAGGGLVLATLLALRDGGDALPAGLVLLSPWLDLEATGESLQTREALDPLFRSRHVSGAALHYCRADQVAEPLVSPVNADLRGLPPAFVQVGDHEILLSDSTRLSDRLSQSGGKVTLQIWPDMWHVFQFFAGQLPESRRAVAAIAEFIRRIVGGAS